MKQLVLRSLIVTVTLGVGSITWAQSAAPTAPNNTGINVRDRHTGAITAGQQSNSKSDLELTRQIRRAVERDDSLSMEAHNVKIISENGVVTLRGPVKTKHDKVTIGKTAREIAGRENVDNRLQVETR